MELFQAIESRRTVKEFRADLVPDELLTRALSAGLWAQNHRLSQPWRFATFGPETMAQFAEYFPRALGIPAIVAVTCLKHDDPEIEREDYAACACAIKTSGWRRGSWVWECSGVRAKPRKTRARRRCLRLDERGESLVGLLFVGFPDVGSAGQGAQIVGRGVAAVGLNNISHREHRGGTERKKECFGRKYRISGVLSVIPLCSLWLTQF